MLAAMAAAVRFFSACYISSYSDSLLLLLVSIDRPTERSHLCDLPPHTSRFTRTAHSTHTPKNQIIFGSCRALVLRHANSQQRAIFVAPPLVLLTAFINVYFVFTKG
jgi:hypothetical protein